MPPRLRVRTSQQFTRARDFARTPYGVIFAAYLALRIMTFAGIGATRVPDSQSWLRLDFSGSEIRLWTIPLFFKLLPADILREVGQVVASIVCWTGLAAVVVRVVEHRRLKPIAFAIVLTSALVTQVTNWDTLILGESLAISVTVALIAAWWLFVLQPNVRTTVLVCVLSLLWAFLRHPNVTITAMIALIVAGSLLIARDRVFRIAILIVLMITLAWGIPTFTKNRFNQDEVLITIISERILTSPSRTAWFAEHGMPDNSHTRSLAGSFYTKGLGSAPIRHDQQLFHWIQTKARSTYFEFLLTHPGYTLGLPAKQALDPDQAALSGTRYGKVRDVLPSPVQELLFDGTGELISLGVAVAMLAIIAFGRRGWSRRELVPAVALLLSIALYWILFHGVASEPLRHYMEAAAAIRVSALLIGLLAVDRLLTRRARPRESPVARTPST